METAGSLITATATATLVDGPDPSKAAASHEACANCQTPTSGRFCSNCGQPTHLHRSLLHVVEEIVHGILHLDGRIWRTLPMLIARPGRMSREYIEGRRTRYVSPIALYLFSVFLMFFVFSLTDGPGIATDVTVDRSEVADAAPVVTADTHAGAESAPPAPVETVSDETSVMTEIREAAENGDIKVETGSPELNKTILKKLKNPEYAFYKIQQTAYKFAFLLIPISLPFVALLFLFRRSATLFDHSVFVLYSMSFMSLLFVTAACLDLLGGIVSEWIPLLLLTAPPIHMFFQLKGTYGLGWFSALWRTLALIMSALFCLSVFIVLIVILGLTG
ncbi:MAG: DUF3667 domain-containing protein [Alphaproteobacteria bacterium]|nr:DUF3667 domain-containing protein [Alphaproteobacteria bacterium]